MQRKHNAANDTAASTAHALIEEFLHVHADALDADNLAEWRKLLRSPVTANSADAQSTPPPGLEVSEGELRAIYYKAVAWLNEWGNGQTALCLSGGGIRSAAFALGVLQGLARYRLLSKFDYLSTVSGGGYIGAWLTAWTHRADRAPAVAADLAEREAVSESASAARWSAHARHERAELAAARAEAARAAASSATASADTFAREIEPRLGNHGENEPEPLSQLRQTQTFLTPKTGLASPDSWTGVATVARNMVLNWLVFVPALAALLLVPRFLEGWLLSYTYQFDSSPDYFLRRLYDCSIFGCSQLYQGAFDHLRAVISLAKPDATYGVTLYDAPGALLVIIGLAYFMSRRPSNGSSDMTDVKFFWRSLLPITLGGLCLLQAIAAANSTNKFPTPAELVRWIAISAAAFGIAGFWATITGIPSLWRTDPRRPPVRFWGELVRRVVDLVGLALAGAVVGLLIWVGLYWLHKVRGDDYREVRDLVDCGLPWLLISFTLGLAAFIVITTPVSALNPEAATRAERDREWLARAAGWCGAVALGWLLLSALVLNGPDVLRVIGERWGIWSIAIVSGIGSVAGGSSPLTRALSATQAARKAPLSAIVSILSVVFIGAVAVLLSQFTVHVLDHFGRGDLNAPVQAGQGFSPAKAHVLGLDRLETVSLAIALLGAFSLIASWFVNVNYFSLNALYRFRLIRTFLGASNLSEYSGGQAVRRNLFDNFRDTDNLLLAELWSEPGGPRRLGPFPVINMTLNLVGGRNLAWQERKAAPFTATPLHAGGNEVGYRPSRDYAGGLTLGTAMSISGAAVSPNWGYHSSPLTTFLLTLFNVRLGAWLGNPRGRGWFGQPWRRDRPLSSLRLLWQEALGKTDADKPYVYLSDGGHFDNLGIYEMLRRRCSTIVVSDAGADPDFKLEDLGNALRKASIDLGVTIIFDPIRVSKRGPDPANPGIYSAVGTIYYPEPHGFEGRIIYVKPSLYEDAPADVRAYAAGNARFPHDTTLNQWFTESQFESYRALGSHAIRMMVGDPSHNESDAHPPHLTVDMFTERVTAYIRRFTPQPPTMVRILS